MRTLGFKEILAAFGPDRPRKAGPARPTLHHRMPVFALSAVTEPLEDRRHFAVTAGVVGTMLVVTGTSSAETITVYQIDAATDQVFVDVNNTGGDLGPFAVNTFSSIKVLGGAGNDTLVVTSAINHPYGDMDVSLPADIRGEGGADTLYGSNQSDTFFGGDNDDQLFDDAGNDTMYGGLGYDRLEGGADNDLMYGDNGGEGVSDGGDTLFGQNGDDRLYGNGGNDSLNGGSGADYMYGGDGNDSLDAKANDGVPDTLDGGNGTADYGGSILGQDTETNIELLLT